jgi:hypothetical protein
MGTLGECFEAIHGGRALFLLPLITLFILWNKNNRSYINPTLDLEEEERKRRCSVCRGRMLLSFYYCLVPRYVSGSFLFAPVMLKGMCSTATTTTLFSIHTIRVHTHTQTHTQVLGQQATAPAGTETIVPLQTCNTSIGKHRVPQPFLLPK